jgi:hypothetical protein
VKKFVLALALAVGTACISSIPAFAAPEGSASATTRIYAGYSSVGQAGASYGGRWNIYEGFSYRIGYISRSYGGRWNIYEGYSRVGYAKPSYGGRWDCYSGYSRIGYVSGRSAAARTCTPVTRVSGTSTARMADPSAAPRWYLAWSEA